MPSGYEKSPDYGGPPDKTPDWVYYLITAILLACGLASCVRTLLS